MTLITPPVVIAEPLSFRAIYNADYKGLPLGAEGIRELVKLDESNYIFTASVTSLWVSIIEQSRFSWNDPENRMRPLDYHYHRTGIGKNRDAFLKFDWVNHAVLNDVQAKPWTMHIPDGVLDKLGYQIKMRADLAIFFARPGQSSEFSYLIADGGRLKTYRFRVLGEEVLDTHIGRLNTVKVERLRISDERSTTFWLARDWDFLLVRLEQMDGGKSNFNLYLKNATVDGVELVGL